MVRTVNFRRSLGVSPTNGFAALYTVIIEVQTFGPCAGNFPFGYYQPRSIRGRNSPRLSDRSSPPPTTGVPLADRKLRAPLMLESLVTTRNMPHTRMCSASIAPNSEVGRCYSQASISTSTDNNCILFRSPFTMRRTDERRSKATKTIKASQSSGLLRELGYLSHRVSKRSWRLDVVRPQRRGIGEVGSKRQLPTCVVVQGVGQAGAIPVRLVRFRSLWRSGNVAGLSFRLGDGAVRRNGV